MTYFFLNQCYIEILLLFFISYLLGSINFSIIVTKVREIEDIRKTGSGNAGFTNVLRVFGIGPAVVTFIGDFLKGVLAVYISEVIIRSNPIVRDDIFVVKYSLYLSGLACLLGHLYPCFFGFKGGKGILVSWAVTLLIDYRLFLILISIFLIVLIFTKIVSIGSLASAFSYPIVVFFITNFLDCAEFYNVTYVIMCTLTSLIIGGIVVCKHIPNIKRLLSGTENKVINVKGE